jgi:hypothetical protein
LHNFLSENFLRKAQVCCPQYLFWGATLKQRISCLAGPDPRQRRGQPEIVYGIIAKRIIEAAQKARVIQSVCVQD